MKSTKLWIADSAEAYANAFMEYVNLRESHLFQVRACTEIEQLTKTLAMEEIEILLITAAWYEDCKDLIHQKCVILLSEGSILKAHDACPSVYKYQSAENILREIMYYYSEQETEERCVPEANRDNRIIGIYSPAGGIGKTLFALTLGQILAESQNVLYLNLEECSGMSEFMGGGHWNISDLIYFLRQQNKTQFLYRLNSMVQKMNHMDYIPACESYTDFCQITVEEWQKLLYLIRVQSSYDSIILDMGNMAGHEAGLLRQCDGIYVPVHQDLISRAQINQWERCITILDGIQVLERLQKLELPECEKLPDSEEDFCLLPHQKLGVYVRELLQE